MAFIVSQKATYAWTVNVHPRPGQARQGGKPRPSSAISRKCRTRNFMSAWPP